MKTKKFWRVEYVCGCVKEGRFKKAIPMRCNTHGATVLRSDKLHQSWLAAL